MDLRHRQEITVGLLVIVAITLFVFGLMYLSGIPLFGGQQITVGVRFTDVSGLSIGDPVRLSGTQVGRVSDIRLEEIGQVSVRLQISDEAWAPRIDATASIDDVDFLGSKYVAYNPGQSPQLLGEGQIIIGGRQANAIDAAGELADQASAVLTGVQSFVEPAVLEQFMTMLQATQQAMLTVSRLGGGLADNAVIAMGSMSRAATRIDSLLANPAIEESVNELDEIMLSLREMSDGLAGVTTGLQTMLDGINAGQGSLGLILHDSTMYYNMNDVLVSLRALLDDMRERPGRYFKLEVF